MNKQQIQNDASTANQYFSLSDTVKYRSSNILFVKSEQLNMEKSQLFPSLTANIRQPGMANNSSKLETVSYKRFSLTSAPNDFYTFLDADDLRLCLNQESMLNDLQSDTEHQNYISV